MKIAALETCVLNVSARTNWTFVRARLADGAEGVGEASLNGWEPLLLVYGGMLSRALVGQEIDAARLRLRTYPHSPGGLVANAARSAAEQALCDAEARSRGVPLWQLLGERRRDRVPVYANINRATVERSPEGCARSALAAVAAGYRAVKIAPFDGVLPDRLDDADAKRAIDVGIARVRAMRAAIGAGVALMVDCHWRFDAPTARVVLERLAPERLHWLECPITENAHAHRDIKSLRDAAAAQGTLLAACELQTSVAGFLPFVSPPIVDVIMPDVKYAGGLAETVRIAEAAAANGVRVSPHNPTGPICNFASLHVAAVAPNVDSLELQVGESDLFFDVVGGARPVFVNGAFVVPDTPGLGAVLDESVLRAHPYQPVGFGLDERLG